MKATSENMVDFIRQSKPVDTSEPYDPNWVAGKTIVITGGASGFGEGMFRKWAEYGANVIIGDITDKRGNALVEEVRKSTDNQNHHYINCNVANWQSQVDFFKRAVKLSKTGGIDAVVANAGLADRKRTFETPTGLDADSPPEPDFDVIQVNFIGVMYTAHLAMFYLPRNPKSDKANTSTKPAANTPDRHLLLVGSVASLSPLPGQVQYCASKHAVLGLFRAMRGTSSLQGVRVNMLCPYYIETPFIPVGAKVILAGGAMGRPEDVVDAATRFMADTRIAGRALVVGPKVTTSIDDDLIMLPPGSKDSKQVAVWEAYAHDYDDVEVFNRRFLKVLNAVEYARGWVGWASDMRKAMGEWWRG
jgi:NAD(P)-dependent dehydrogenase (short-subunit alcohol dehydrogenase family)